jgi:PPOX class probable F420-dependent enzyme
MDERKVFMLDLSTEFGRQVEKRLREDDVIWFTTISPNATPAPNPVWFFWDGDEIIVYSKPDSYRVRNIEQNSKVALNLEGADALGNNVVIIQGEASLNPDYKRLHPEYASKYAQYLPDLNVTVEELVTAYTVEIRVKPLRVRGE